MANAMVSAFRKSLKKFCRESTLPGLNVVVNPRKTWLERLTWAFVNLSLMVITFVFVLNSFEQTFKNPIIVSLETTSYPIGNVPFPGISICNVNKISKQRIEQMAIKIRQETASNFESYKYVLNKGKLLGHLYKAESENRIDFQRFQQIVEKHLMQNELTVYDLMKNLAPSCEELLYQCWWNNKIKNCSELFETRITFEGFCCTFNYVRHRTLKPIYLNESGWNSGLRVTILNNVSDYYYPYMSFVGVNVHIFNSNNFPDIYSGNLISTMVGIGTDTNLVLTSNSYYVVPAVRRYSIKTRKCIFNDERPLKFGSYTMANCLVACRAKSVLALCQCFPFNIPQLPPRIHNITPCFLTDIPCLNQYRDKWLNLKPPVTAKGLDGLDRERESSLECDCKIACNGTSYEVTSYSTPLQSSEKNGETNFSIVRIYYNSNVGNIYQTDVVSYWYEILGNVGGILGLFLGISIMTVIRFLYDITIFLVYYLINP